LLWSIQKDRSVGSEEKGAQGGPKVQTKTRSNSTLKKETQKKKRDETKEAPPPEPFCKIPRPPVFRSEGTFGEKNLMLDTPPPNFRRWKVGTLPSPVMGCTKTRLTHSSRARGEKRFFLTGGLKNGPRRIRLEKNKERGI